MPLRRSPRRTAALLEANRRNARKSTGPRTLRGKAQSRLNALRTGLRSFLYDGLWWALIDAPLGAAEQTAATILTPEMAAHPVFAETVQAFWQLETEDILNEEVARLNGAGASGLAGNVRPNFFVGEAAAKKTNDETNDVYEKK